MNLLCYFGWHKIIPCECAQIYGVFYGKDHEWCVRCGEGYVLHKTAAMEY